MKFANAGLATTKRLVDPLLRDELVLSVLFADRVSNIMNEALDTRITSKRE